MHRALRTPGQAQTVALRVLSSSAKTKTTPSGEGGAASATVGGEDAVRQRRDLVVTLVEVGLTGADGSMVAAAARALPARPCDLAAILSGLGPTSAGTATSSKVSIWRILSTLYNPAVFLGVQGQQAHLTARVMSCLYNIVFYFYPQRSSLPLGVAISHPQPSLPYGSARSIV